MVRTTRDETVLPHSHPAGQSSGIALPGARAAPGSDGRTTRAQSLANRPWQTAAPDHGSHAARGEPANVRASVRRRAGAARRPEMPRERLLALGPAALSNVELVALILGSGLRGHNVFDVARSLLERFRSLRAMLGAAPAQFEGLRGIGHAKTAQLLAIIELSRRALAEELEERPLIDSPQAVEQYLRLQISARPHEVFVCLFLDARHRLLRYEEMSRGSLTRMAVYPREIVRQALASNAAGLIVAHNHPSGAVRPSTSDQQLTRVLRDALALIDVQLIDHLVIGGRDIYSFARAGWADLDAAPAQLPPTQPRRRTTGTKRV